LTAPPANVAEDAPVLVTLLAPDKRNLAAYNISPEQAAELRGRMATFAADWDAPAVPAYDNYDAMRAAWTRSPMPLP